MVLSMCLPLTLLSLIIACWGDSSAKCVCFRHTGWCNGT